jgi:hypothetical protein
MLPLCSDPVFDAIGASSRECEFLHQPLEQLLVDGLDRRECVACKLKEKDSSVQVDFFNPSTNVLGTSSCCNVSNTCFFCALDTR